MIHLPRINVNEIDLINLAIKYKISELYFFGSILRDDFNEKSDIDIMVVFNKTVDYDYFDLMQIKSEFAKYFNREIDLVEKDALVNPFRKASILTTAMKIYAA